MQNPKGRDDTPQSNKVLNKAQNEAKTEEPNQPQDMTPAPDDYSHRNSGRRASGHGGGDMDAPEEFPEAHHEAGYDFSGGGRGHESNRSLAHESDEDLESRSGPYTRAGQPAQAASQSGQDKAGTQNKSGKGEGSKT